MRLQSHPQISTRLTTQDTGHILQEKCPGAAPQWDQMWPLKCSSAGAGSKVLMVSGTKISFHRYLQCVSSHYKGPAWLRAPALTQHHHQLHKWAPVQQLLFNTPGSHRAPLQDVVQCSQGQCDKGTQTLMARAIEANKASSP